MPRTLFKRTHRTVTPPHAPGPEGRAMRTKIRHDAAELAATLRALATQAHEAVKATGDHSDGSMRHELSNLRNAIAQLEDDFRSQNLTTMVPYLVALREQVESKLT
jgi:Spy/CpxP family protein refolding chaperone